MIDEQVIEPMRDACVACMWHFQVMFVTEIVLKLWQLLRVTRASIPIEFIF
jgi:hypothetical protein